MKKLLIILIALLISGEGWGATIYFKDVSGTKKWNADAWPTAGAGTAGDFQDACDQAGNSGTVILGDGTYSNAAIDSDYYAIIAQTNLTIRLPEPGDADYPANLGTVTLTTNGTDHVMRNDASTTTIRGQKDYPITILYTGTTASKFALYNNASLNATYVIFSNNHNNSLYNANAGTNTFNYCKFLSWSNSVRYAAIDSTSASTYNYCIFEGNGVGLSGGGEGVKTSTVNNCVFSGFERALLNDHAQHTITAKNCWFIGHANSVEYNIIIETAGSINIANSIIFYPWKTPRQNALTITNGTVSNVTYNASRLIKTPSRDGAIVVSVDDATNADHAAYVKTALDALDVHFTWNVNTKDMNAVKWDQARDMISGGHDIGLHQYSNTALSYDHALRFSQTGGANQTVAFDGTTIILNADGTDYDNSYVVTGKTVGEIVTALNGVKGWTVAKSTTGSQTATKIADEVKATSLKTMTATAAPCDIDFDRTAYNAGYFKDEITDPKAEIEAQIQALGGAYATWSVYSAAHAMGLFDATSKAAMRSAGIKNNRSDTAIASTATWTISNLDMMQSPKVVSTTYLGATVEEVTSSAKNHAFASKQLGIVIALMIHDEAGWATSDTSLLTAYISTLKAEGARIYSHREYYDWIASFATDDGDGSWSYAWVNNPDYHPTSSSPCINAGTDVWTGTANVTDYAGTAITNAAGVLVAPGGKVDIGAYEYKPSINNAARFLLLFD